MINSVYYRDKESFLNRLDPRVKLICTIFLNLLILRAQILVLSIICLLITFCLLHLKVGLKRTLISFKYLLPLFIVLFLAHILFLHGDIRVGLYYGFLVNFRFFLLVLISTLFIVSTRLSDMIFSVEWLISPFQVFRIPVKELSFMIGMGLRFFPLLFEEFQSIKEVALLRGLEMNAKNPFKILRAYSILILPLIRGLFKKAEELSQALEARSCGRDILDAKRKREILQRIELQ